MIHDISGITPDLRNEAKWLAGEGFLTIAPDLLSWGKELSCVRSIIRAVRAREGRAYTVPASVRPSRSAKLASKNATRRSPALRSSRASAAAIAVRLTSAPPGADVTSGGCG